MEIIRCPWCLGDPLYMDYHDREWGVPLYVDRRLFEMLVLEGAQAGLSWLTILRKRENYREAFGGFDPERIATFSGRDVERLMKNPGIVRNRLKLESAVKNARAFLTVAEELGSFSSYLWGFVERRPVQNRWRRLEDLPQKTAASDAMSRDLKKRGFSFVGTTICYAFMQSTGMVNDHLVACFRSRELGGLSPGPQESPKGIGASMKGAKRH